MPSCFSLILFLFLLSLLVVYLLPYLLPSFSRSLILFCSVFFIFIAVLPHFLKLSGCFVSFSFMSFSFIFLSLFFLYSPLSLSSFTFYAFPFIFYCYFLFFHYNILTCTCPRHAVCAILRSQFNCKVVVQPVLILFSRLVLFSAC